VFMNIKTKIGIFFYMLIKLFNKLKINKHYVNLDV